MPRETGVSKGSAYGLCVEELLANQLDAKYDDKLFWYASKVSIRQDRIDLFVRNESLVGFDDVGYDGIKKVSQMQNNVQSDKTLMHDVLVSSGSFLFINDGLVVTRRNTLTRYDPECWTTPAGRCDRTILQTAVKETVEEIRIHQGEKILYPDIAADIVTDRQNVRFYPTTPRNINFPLKLYDVRLYLDSRLIEETTAWVYYSEAVNTLEFRIPIFSCINPCGLHFSNPEFGTETGLKTVEELSRIETVPALTRLLHEIRG